MSWNYRVMTLDHGESYEIHEVYYDEENKPHAYTVNAVKPYGESTRELQQDLMWMLAALEKPVLTPDDFPETQE